MFLYFTIRGRPVCITCFVSIKWGIIYFVIILTLARVPCFATFASGEGGRRVVRPPGDRPPIVVEPRRKKSVDAFRRDIAIAYILVLGQHLTSLVQVKGQIFAKITFFSFTRSSGRCGQM